MLNASHPATRRDDSESGRVPRTRSILRHRWQHGWSECSRDSTASAEHRKASAIRKPQPHPAFLAIAGEPSRFHRSALRPRSQRPASPVRLKHWNKRRHACGHQPAQHNFQSRTPSIPATPVSAEKWDQPWLESTAALPETRWSRKVPQERVLNSRSLTGVWVVTAPSLLTASSSGNQFQRGRLVPSWRWQVLLHRWGVSLCTAPTRSRRILPAAFTTPTRHPSPMRLRSGLPHRHSATILQVPTKGVLLFRPRQISAGHRRRTSDRWHVGGFRTPSQRGGGTLWNWSIGRRDSVIRPAEE